MGGRHLFLALIVLTAAGVLVYVSRPVTGHDRARVAVEGAGDSAVVCADVADTMVEQYVGLSRTGQLDAGEGMLFVFRHDTRQEMVMRGMEYDLDILFIDGGGTVTAVRTAPHDSDETYVGRGKYVLEVPRGYAADHEIREGDSVRVEYCSEGGDCCGTP